VQYVKPQINAITKIATVIYFGLNISNIYSLTITHFPNLFASLLPSLVYMSHPLDYRPQIPLQQDTRVH
jgi:hypothetical protein